MIYDVAFYLQNDNEELNHLQTDNMAKYIEEEFSKKISLKDSGYLNYIGLSAHDMTLGYFVVNLGLGNWKCNLKKYLAYIKNPNKEVDDKACWKTPHFADNFIWELSHMSNKDKVDEYYVR